VTWRRTRLRYLLQLTEVIGQPDRELLSVYREYGVIRKSDRADNFNKPGSNLALYQVVNKGDLVINRMKAWQGSLGVSPFDGIVSPDYYVCRVDPGINGRFLHHLLRSKPLVAEYGARSTGIRSNQWRLPWAGLADIEVALPSADSQAELADLLDRENEAVAAALQRLDQLVTDMRELLIAERSELMRTASEEGTVALRHVVDILDGRRIPLNAEARALRPGPIPYWGANSIQDYIDDYLFDETLVLIGEDGAPFFDDRRDVSWVVRGKTWVNNHAHVLRPHKGWDPDFVAQALNAVDYGTHITGATRDKLTQNDLRAIRIPMVPVEDQKSIARRLAARSAQVARGAVAGAASRAALAEYREALTVEVTSGGALKDEGQHEAVLPGAVA
jgi:type I restriction enzyme S subunit